MGQSCIRPICTQCSLLSLHRNGLHYGVQVRAPHALVMTMLFKAGQPLKSNLISILTVFARLPCACQPSVLIQCNTERRLACALMLC